VIDMCIENAYDFLPQEKENEELRWVTVAGMLRKEGKKAISTT